MRRGNRTEVPQTFGRMVFKRKRIYAPRRSGAKRRRFGSSRFRRRRFGQRSSGYTSKAGGAVKFGFKSRRVGQRRWRSVLWRDTLAQTHYRSNNAINTINTNSGNAQQYQTTPFAALRIGGQQFYTQAGGAIPPDGGTVGLFLGNIVIRGGIIGMRVCNINSGATTIGVRVYLIKTSENVSFSSIPANVPIGWDPTLVQDFQKNIGTVVLKREAILENNAALDVKYRLRPWKIDRDLFDLDQRSYVWLVLQNDFEGAASAVSNCAYFNISFAADAIGTA